MGKDNVLNVDSYDRFTFQTVKEESDKLKTLEKWGSDRLPTFPSLLEDTFGAMYKYSPKVLGADDTPAHLKMNRRIVDELMTTSEYRELRNYTRLDDFQAAVAVTKFGDYMNQKLPPEVQENASKMQAAQRVLDKMMQEMDLPNPDDPNAQQTTEEVRKAVKEVKTEIAKLSKEVDKAMDKHGDAIRVAVRTAASQATEEVQTMDMIMGTLAGTGAGQEQQLSMTDKLEMAKKLRANPIMLKVAALAGRMQRLAVYYQENKVKHGMDEIVDTETGDNVEHLVPSEFAYLDDEDLQYDFYRRFYERALLQFKMEGKETEGRGPIVICMDDSSSMTEGDRVSWSRAFAVGLLTIAQKQHREFSIVHFGSQTELKIFPQANKEPKKLLDALSWFFNGGTNFQVPLQAAAGLIESGKCSKKADIVFVTDGECSVPKQFADEFTAWRKAKEVKLLWIDVNPKGKERTLDDLPVKSDSVFNFWGSDEHVLEGVFGRI